MRRTLLAVILLLSCAAPRLPAVHGPCQEVYGACVLYSADSSARFSRAELERAVRISATYWGEKPELNGWVIIVHGEWPLPIGYNMVWGITIPDYHRIDFVVQDPHCPTLVLVHELGHAFSVIAGHDGRPHGENEDPKFNDKDIYRALRDGGVCR